MYVNIIKYLHLICKPVPFVRFILIGSLNLFSINFKMRQSGDDNIKPVSLHKSTQPVSKKIINGTMGPFVLSTMLAYF